MNLHKWEPSLFNTGWKMTRIEGECIAVRDITLWDKIIHWRRIVKKNRYIKSLKGCTN